MESLDDSDSLGYCLKYRKAMLRCVMMPYMDLHDVGKLLFLSKTAKHLAQETYLENWEAMSHLMLRRKWKVTEEDY